jgi:protocatechuate 4,5-dioxygenase beta chain/2'-aminobiphenyl-2,3-diol 1,2-dioxygenase large subunit
MGQIVGAFAMSHQLGSPDGVEEQSDRVFQGMREIGRRIRALAPDVLVVVSSDHLNNFSLGEPAPFAVGTAETFHPLGDMGLPRDPVPGAPEFAAGLLAFAQARRVAISAAEGIQPDHGVMIPLGIVDPARSIPAVPLYVNTVFYPEPSPAHSRELGEVLRAYIEQLPGKLRVVLLGAGGLSHWVGMPDEGRINEPWDRAFLAEVLNGDLVAMAARDNGETLEVAGNGGLEINAWIVVVAAAGAASGERVFYEAMPSWATGMGGVELKPAV